MTPDPLAHETVACPYPFYDTMCAQSGVSCVADHEWFLVTSFEKASEVLRNPELPGTNPQELATTPDGELVAIGEDWTTPTSDFHRPEWPNNISQLIVAPTPS